MLLLGIACRQEAGVHTARLKLHPTLSLLGREALDTIYYYHSLDLEENHLAVPSGPSAGFTHPDLS